MVLYVVDQSHSDRKISWEEILPFFFFFFFSKFFSCLHCLAVCLQNWQITRGYCLPNFLVRFSKILITKGKNVEIVTFYRFFKLAEFTKVITQKNQSLIQMANFILQNCSYNLVHHHKWQFFSNLNYSLCKWCWNLMEFFNLFSFYSNSNFCPKIFQIRGFSAIYD